MGERDGDGEPVGDEKAGVGRAVDDGNVVGGNGDGGETPGDAEMACPECDEPLPSGARFCPHCRSALSEDGDAVDLSELDGRFDPTEQPEFLAVDDAGRRRASGRVRALAGLAVAIPLAPLALFLVGSVAPLSVWTAPLVFLGAWLVFGAALSRARVPAEAFGWSLYLVAASTALLPVALRFGDSGIASDELSISLEIVGAVALAVAGLTAVLGRYVNRQARRRVTGEKRAFESAREE